jgi:hypothetical protein
MGYGEASYVGRPTDADFAECQRWFGPDVTWLERGTGQSTPLHGHIGLPFRPLYDQGKTGPVLGIEYGTLPSPEVRAALRADHWLHARGQLDSAQGREIKRRLRDVFYVDTDAWKAQVIARADELTGKALHHLAALSAAGAGRFPPQLQRGAPPMTPREINLGFMSIRHAIAARAGGRGGAGRLRRHRPAGRPLGRRRCAAAGHCPRIRALLDATRPARQRDRAAAPAAR